MFKKLKTFAGGKAGNSDVGRTDLQSDKRYAGASLCICHSGCFPESDSRNPGRTESWTRRIYVYWSLFRCFLFQMYAGCDSCSGSTFYSGHFSWSGMCRYFWYFNRDSRITFKRRLPGNRNSCLWRNYQEPDKYRLCRTG